jgi:small-conductance mechanosensitive channel
MRRVVQLRALVLGFVLTFAWQPFGYAQLPKVPTAEPSKAPPSADEIKPIPSKDIATRADEDERFAQAVEARTRQRSPAVKLRPELEELAQGTRRLAKRFAPTEVDRLLPARLDSLERYWNFYDRRLGTWRADLQASLSRYSDDAAELSRRRAAWEATRNAADSTSLSASLRQRVDVVLTELNEADAALSRPLDQLLALSTAGNSLQATIDLAKRSVAAANKAFDRRLLVVDSPSLPQIWRDRKVAENPLANTAGDLSVTSEFVLDYFRHSTHRLRLHAIFAFVALPVLIWLWVRARRLVSTDPELRESAQVLMRPISAWLVLVLLATLLFESDGPLALHETALFLALIPVLRLLPREVFRVLGGWPYLATGLYLLYRIGFGLLLGQPLWMRVHLLVMSALALVAMVWLLLVRRPPTGQPVGWQLRTVRFIGWAVVAALLVAIASNFVGNLSLAVLLTSGAIESAYLGLALYAGASVISAMLRLLLARKSVSRFKVVTQHSGPLLEGIAKLVKWIAALVWVTATLHQFRAATPVTNWLKAVLNHPLEAGNVSVTLGSILLFVFSVYLAFWLARTIRVVLAEDVLANMALPRGVANSISSLSYYALIVLGLLVALAVAGFHVSELAIVLGALGVGIGLGLQDVVKNFVSGLILMFERPIQPGDIVEVSGTSGKIREIGMRATTLTTFEGADVVVPNGTLLSEKLINWTLSDMNRRIDVNVGVAYGTDPRRVLEILMDVARATPGVASTPEPFVVFTGFGPSSLDFGVRAWTNDFNTWVATRSDLTLRVHDALRDAGIEIPFSQHDLHLRSVSPEVRAGLARYVQSQSV